MVVFRGEYNFMEFFKGKKKMVSPQSDTDIQKQKLIGDGPYRPAPILRNIWWMFSE